MAWLLIVTPAAALAFALGHLGNRRIRSVLLAILIAAPLFVSCGVLVLGLGIHPDLLTGARMIALVMAAWAIAVAASYLAASRLA